MTDLTPLDLAHRAMQDAPDDETRRLGFFERLADAELFLLLNSEAEGSTVDPRVFPVDGQDFVLVFDRVERLTEFAGQIVPYVGLSGRSIAGMLAGQGIGFGLNLDVAPSSILIPADAVGWLDSMTARQPQEQQDQPVEFSSPVDLPQGLIQSLNTKLAMAGERAELAYLVAVTYTGGRQGHLLGFVDAHTGAHAALSRSVNEALIFSGMQSGWLDVAFFERHDEICARLAKVGLRFDLPKSTTPNSPQPPGMDPDNPPILR